MSRSLIVLCGVVWFAGCSGKEGDCDAITPGPWSMDGSCLGMAMTASLTVAEDGCSFTFDDWDMPMESLPSGGTMGTGEVTLDWSDKTECTGTSDGSSMSGTCSDGCDFEASAG